MLSRLDDARVFLSSDDVVLGSRAARRGPGVDEGPLEAATGQRALGADSGSDEDALEDEEDEEHAQLHPQHPYNMRQSRAAAVKALAVREPGPRRSTRRRLADSAASQPMELVMLPSGDIRPRDECPPGMVLPPPPPGPVPASRVGRRLEIGEISDDSPQGQRRQDEKKDEDGSDRSEQEKPRVKRTESRRRTSGREERRERPVTERRTRVQQATTDRRRLETPPRRTTAPKRRGGMRYASSGGEDETGFASASSLSSSDHAGASTRNGVGTNAAHRRQPQQNTRALDVDSDEEDVDHLASHSRRRMGPNTRMERARQALTISRQRTPKASSRSRQEPETRGNTALPKKLEVAPVYHIADEDEDEDENEDEEEPVEQVKKPSERTRRQQTPKADKKLDVNQLVSSKEEEKTSMQARQSKLVRQLEQELQNEKKRVLEKMTLLLEEQGKNQQLHRQIEEMENQLESSTRNAASTASETQRWEERVHVIERKHAEVMKAMEEQLQQRDAVVLRLEQDKNRLKDAVSKLRERSGRQNGNSPHAETDSDVKSQLEQLAASIRKFLKRVDRWKGNSKEAMECCDRKADLAALMENMWLDFPQFPNWKDTSKSDNNAAEASDGGQGENIVRFLKKRVRSREDELRQLQAKYVELKELCARQCVREADLQNFINEHRLRGNLVIRKGGNGDADEAKKRTTPRQQREGKAPPSSRAAKPESYYAEDDEEYEQGRHHENNNDYESGEEEEEDDDVEDNGEYPVREPKIFVQVGRDGVYEHTPGGASAVLEKLEDQQHRQGRKKASQVEVERIRLVPSLSLSQRHVVVVFTGASSPDDGSSSFQAGGFFEIHFCCFN